MGWTRWALRVSDVAGIRLRDASSRCRREDPHRLSDRSGRLLGPAVLAPAGSGRNIVGEASWAGLYRWTFAENGCSLTGHDVLVRGDDEEIHDQHEDDEVDDGGDE